MEARISLSEPVARRLSRGQEDLAWENAVASESEKDRIQALVNTGLVTHRFKSAEQLDMMFAISELHDFSEVTFVAVLRAGEIFLGCPDGPPESLIELVEPVNGAQDTRENPAGIERIDVISQRLEMLADALQPDAPPHPKLAPKDGATDLAAVHTMLERLHEKMDNVFQIETNATDEKAPEDAEIIDAVIEHEPAQSDDSDAEGSSPSEQRAEPDAEAKGKNTSLIAQFDEILDVLSEMNDGVSQIREHQGTQDEAIEKLLQAHVSQSDKTQAASEKQVQTLTEELGTLKTLAQTVVPQVSEGFETLASIQAQVAELSGAGAMAEMMTAQKAAFEKLETTLSAPAQDAAPPVWLDGVTTTLEAISQQIVPGEQAQIAQSVTELGAQMQELVERTQTAENDMGQAMEQRLCEVQQDIKRLAAIPKPVLDLTEQRRSFATFTTAVSAITQRLEATADRLLSLDETSATDETLKRIEDRLDAVQNATKELETPISALNARVDALGAEAKTDLAEATSQVIEHLQTSGPVDPSPVDFDPVLEKLETLVAQTSGVPKDVSALRSDVALALSGGDRDLTAQRQGFARFGVAMSATLQRLEAIAGAISQNEEDTTPNAVLDAVGELKAQLDAVSQAQSEHLAAVTQQLSALGGENPAPDSQTDPPAQAPEEQISLDDLRYLFAETVAAHIQRTKVEAPEAS